MDQRLISARPWRWHGDIRRAHASDGLRGGAVLPRVRFRGDPGGMHRQGVGMGCHVLLGGPPDRPLLRRAPLVSRGMGPGDGVEAQSHPVGGPQRPRGRDRPGFQEGRPEGAGRAVRGAAVHGRIGGPHRIHPYDWDGEGRARHPEGQAPRKGDSPFIRLGQLCQAVRRGGLLLLDIAQDPLALRSEGAPAAGGAAGRQDTD